jgi:hypothetical protein
MATESDAKPHVAESAAISVASMGPSRIYVPGVRGAGGGRHKGNGEGDVGGVADAAPTEGDGGAARVVTIHDRKLLRRAVSLCVGPFHIINPMETRSCRAASARTRWRATGNSCASAAGEGGGPRPLSFRMQSSSACGCALSRASMAPLSRRQISVHLLAASGQPSCSVLVLHGCHVKASYLREGCMKAGWIPLREYHSHVFMRTGRMLRAFMQHERVQRHPCT